MATVLLAHSHPGVRAWVRDALVQAPDVEFVAEVSDGGEAWRLVSDPLGCGAHCLFAAG